MEFVQSTLGPMGMGLAIKLFGQICWGKANVEVLAAIF